ncbi:MAG TPA: GNAT family N-acetyltransferase [Methanosarcina sp.]|jgi:lipid II:glycine glycyltransferase (peptidoglycan interpeptide bridge formation enzyme)
MFTEGFIIICRKATDKDKKQWDNVVIESLNGTFFHTWEWKEVIEKGLNSEALPLVVEDEKENKIIGVFPFFVRNIFEDNKINKSFPIVSNKFQYGCSPYRKLYSFGGPCVLSSIADSEKIYNLMFDFIDKYCKNKRSISENWIYPYHSCLDSVLVQNGYTKAGMQKTAIINIERDLNEICKGFKKQFSKDIRRASRNGVIVYESQNYFEDLDLYFNYFQKILVDSVIERTNNKYNRVSGAILPYSYFEEMRDVLFPEKMARLFFAEYNGVKIGALINFYYKDTVYLGHTSVLRGEYNDLNAYKLLIWHSIVDGNSKKYKNLDLTGLHPDESNGQYRFKMGFNGQIKEIIGYNKSYRYNEIKHIKKIVNELRKRVS